HTRCLSDWSSDVCSSDLVTGLPSTPSRKAMRQPQASRAWVKPFNIVDRSYTKGRGSPCHGGVRVVSGRPAYNKLLMSLSKRSFEIGRASCRERGGIWLGD